jgi:hypothetical protein
MDDFNLRQLENIKRQIDLIKSLKDIDLALANLRNLINIITVVDEKFKEKFESLITNIDISYSVGKYRDLNYKENIDKDIIEMENMIKSAFYSSRYLA